MKRVPSLRVQQSAAPAPVPKLLAILLLTGSLMGLTGCSESSDASSKPTQPPTTAAASASSTVDSEDAAIIAAYTRSWEARTEAYSKASVAGTDVKKTTTLRALFDIETDLTTMREAGQVTTGKPVIHPKVTKVIPGKIRKATVTDCVDTTNWTLIDKASKKAVPLPTTRLIKYVSTATLEKWGKTWMVTKFTAQDQSC